MATGRVDTTRKSKPLRLPRGFSFLDAGTQENLDHLPRSLLSRLILLCALDPLDVLLLVRVRQILELRIGIFVPQQGPNYDLRDDDLSRRTVKLHRHRHSVSSRLVYLISNLPLDDHEVAAGAVWE